MSFRRPQLSAAINHQIGRRTQKLFLFRLGSNDLWHGVTLFHVFYCVRITFHAFTVFFLWRLGPPPAHLPFDTRPRRTSTGYRCCSSALRVVVVVHFAILSTCGAHGGDRTPDPRLKRALLFLLSYMSVFLHNIPQCGRSDLSYTPAL